MAKFLLLLVLPLIYAFSEMTPRSNEDHAAYSYIEQYSELAVVEMHRSGIPASITLAQGLLESSNGQSDLATNANNHFGIKCKSYWRGMTYYHKDDDKNAKGQLINSCFRAYDNAIDSYVDHTNFLKESDRYSILFSFSTTDYISWAHGLKSCGYATDPNYATKVIARIEQFQLDRYDYWPYPLQVSIKNR